MLRKNRAASRLLPRLAKRNPSKLLEETRERSMTITKPPKTGRIDYWS